ncbi:D-amino-acid transaminase, partial [Halalkalibacterium halodurans]
MDYCLYQDQLVPREQLKIDPEDRGYHFGDGIYEVVHVYHGKAFALSDHLTRFKESAEKLDLPMLYSTDKLGELVQQLIEKNKLEHGMVYFQMTRGISPRNHLYTRNETPVLTGFSKPLPDEKRESVRLYLTDDIRWLRCDIKTINLLGNVLAKREATDHQCDEALLHRDGTVTEGSSSNVFLIKNETLYTHPATNLILNGITRQITIRLAKAKGYTVVEEPFPKEVIKDADEAFITSTIHEITPVTEVIGDETAHFPVGPVTKMLQQAFAEEIAKHSQTAMKELSQKS